MPFPSSIMYAHYPTYCCIKHHIWTTKISLVYFVWYVLKRFCVDIFEWSNSYSNNFIQSLSMLSFFGIDKNVYCRRILWTLLVILKSDWNYITPTIYIDIHSICYSEKVCPYNMVFPCLRHIRNSTFFQLNFVDITYFVYTGYLLHVEKGNHAYPKYSMTCGHF